MRYTRADAIRAETYWARRLGIPEAWAHAEAEVESHHDPYAIGDHGTSFGDYQLHVGGLLGSHTPDWAFNPWNNAGVALTHLLETIRLHPGVHDPGTLAALSQAPADPRGYAAKVNAAMQTAGAGTSTSSTSGPQSTELAGFWSSVGHGFVWTYDHSLGWTLHGAKDVTEGAAGAIAAPFVAFYNLLRGIWDFFTSQKTWIRIGLFAGGLVLIIGGAKIAFASDMPAVIPV